MTEGIIARFRTMAISRASVLTGHVLGSLIQTMLSLAVVIGVALLVGFRPTAGPLDWLAAIGVLAMIDLRAHLAVGRARPGEQERRDREQPPDAPDAAAVPRQRVRPDRLDAGRAALVRRVPAVHARSSRRSAGCCWAPRSATAACSPSPGAPASAWPATSGPSACSTAIRRASRLLLGRGRPREARGERLEQQLLVHVEDEGRARLLDELDAGAQALRGAARRVVLERRRGGRWRGRGPAAPSATQATSRNHRPASSQALVERGRPRAPLARAWPPRRPRARRGGGRAWPPARARRRRAPRPPPARGRRRARPRSIAIHGRADEVAAQRCARVAPRRPAQAGLAERQRRARSPSPSAEPRAGVGGVRRRARGSSRSAIAPAGGGSKRTGWQREAIVGSTLAGAVGEQQEVREGGRLLERLEHPVGRLRRSSSSARSMTNTRRRASNGVRAAAATTGSSMSPTSISVRAARRDPGEVGMRRRAAPARARSQGRRRPRRAARRRTPGPRRACPPRPGRGRGTRGWARPSGGSAARQDGAGVGMALGARPARRWR